MKAVGLRELKNRLSEYIRLVRSGQSIQVTDRGEVVAELTPPQPPAGQRNLPAGLLELARQGQVRLGRGNDPSFYRKLPRARLRGITSAELLDQERGER